MEYQVEQAMYYPRFIVDSAFTSNIERKHGNSDSSCMEGATLFRAIGLNVSCTVTDLYQKIVALPEYRSQSAKSLLPKGPTRPFFHQEVLGGDEQTTVWMIAHLWLQHACSIYPHVAAYYATQPVALRPNRTINGATMGTILDKLQGEFKPISTRYVVYVLYLLLPVVDELSDAVERVVYLDKIYGLLATNKHTDLRTNMTVDNLDTAIHCVLPRTLCQLVLDYCVADTATLLARFAARFNTVDVQQHIVSLEAREATILQKNREKAEAELKKHEAEWKTYMESDAERQRERETQRRQSAIERRRNGRGRRGGGRSRDGRSRGSYYLGGMRGQSNRYTHVSLL